MTDNPEIFQVQLWLVFKVSKSHGMEFGGVFDDESLAVAACISREYGYGPAILNENIPDATENWRGFRYPLIEAEYAEAGEEYPINTNEQEQPSERTYSKSPAKWG